MSDKHLYTNTELFKIIVKQLEEKGLVPSILDYSLADKAEIEIKNDEWDVIGRVEFGTNEGIYLTIYLEGSVTSFNSRESIVMGTFKTLDRTKAAYKAMSDLNVEFVFAVNDFVRDNRKSFNWLGFSSRFIYNGKPASSGFWSATKENLLNTVKRCIPVSNAEAVIITDNATDKTETIKREELI